MGTFGSGNYLRAAVCSDTGNGLMFQFEFSNEAKSGDPADLKLTSFAVVNDAGML